MNMDYKFIHAIVVTHSENYSNTAIKLMMNAAFVGKMTQSTTLLFTVLLLHQIIHTKSHLVV